jgi:hypothetical protein
VKRLARLGVDPMLNFFMHKGFPVALTRVADGFKLGMNKTGSGADAIEQWLHGGYEGRVGVVDYCENDVVVMVLVVSAISHRKCITWITKSSSKEAHWSPMRSRKLLMPTEQAMAMASPDNQWMKPRLTKEDFIGWLK